MVTRDTPWPDGTPCWADIMATDAAAARTFYAALFGWDVVVGEDTGGYGLATIAGRNVSGIGQMPEGHPAAWTCYLASSDADATADAITKAGGTVIEPPMDVMAYGRMVLATDPTGGFFGVWQAGEHHGAQVANEPNAIIWNEVLTRDFAAAKDFYSTVFGWTYAPMGDTYAMFEVDGNTAGGIGELPPGVPAVVAAHWRNFFAVDDADAAVAKAVELGGSVARPAEDLPYGRHADLVDPQGALFCVITSSAPE